MHKPEAIFVLAHSPGSVSLPDGASGIHFKTRHLVGDALQRRLDFWIDEFGPLDRDRYFSIIPEKTPKRTSPIVEISTNFPYASNPSKLDTCWYMLAGNDESDTYLCNLSEDSVHPIRKIWNIFCPLVHIGKDIVTWSEKNPGQDAMHTVTTHFVDMRSGTHTEFSGIWEHYGVFRSHGASFLVLRPAQSFGESDYLRNIYRWDGQWIAQVEGMSFSQAIGGDFEKVHIEKGDEERDEVECVIGMRQGTSGTIVFEGVSHEWVVYSLRKERGEWYGKQKTPHGQRTFDFG